MTRSGLQTGPAILDAVEDQTGTKWLRFGTAERNVWIKLVEVGSLSGSTLHRLQQVGYSLLTNASKETFKRGVEAVADYRRASLATHPGWTRDTYVHGDGTAYDLRRSEGSVIVAFDRDLRFAKVGSLEEWQAALGPIARNQPLVLVALTFAFVGPLLRFMPPDVQNPIIEIVGPRERGKSSLVYAASAVVGGDRCNRMGVARSWNFTPARLDEIRAGFADSLLVLDEANLAGRSLREKAEAIESAVFRLAETSPRERFGETTAMQVRQAVMSTSNATLKELVGSDTEIQAAVVSRVLTLHANRKFGIFDSLPAEMTGGQAAAAFMAGSARNAGAPAHAFSVGLASFPARSLERGVQAGFGKGVRYFLRHGLDARQANILATVFVAGRIANQLGILPKDWGDIGDACKAMANVATAPAGQLSALDHIRAYVDRHEAQLLGIEDIGSPLSPPVFDAALGFISRDRKHLIIPTKSPTFCLPESRAWLQQLKSQGRLQHDPRKLSKKAPRPLTSGRPRAYYIDIG